jgi:hypothetical protein
MFPILIWSVLVLFTNFLTLLLLFFLNLDIENIVILFSTDIFLVIRLFISWKKMMVWDVLLIV